MVMQLDLWEMLFEGALKESKQHSSAKLTCRLIIAYCRYVGISVYVGQ